MNTNPTYKNIHNRFELNGVHYSFEDLFEIAYSFVKEGTPHEQGIGDFLLDWIHPSSEITLKTSGSTGAPKHMTFEKQALVQSALATGDFFGLKVGDRALHCLNTDFIAGKMMLVRAMILGLSLDLTPPEGNVLAHSDKTYDFVAMVPLQVANAFNALDRVKTLIIGGAPMPSSLRQKVQDTHKGAYETYGMTETLTHIAARKIKKGIDVFTVLPSIEVEQDKKECLVIHAPYLSKEPVHTHDIVSLVSAREFHLRGRSDNIINSGGVKLIPEEIEKKLSDIIARPFFVASQPDDTLGEALILLVEGETNTEALTKKIGDLPTLEKYQKPRTIYTLPSFVYTENGKIQRQASRAQLDL